MVATPKLSGPKSGFIANKTFLLRCRISRTLIVVRLVDNNKVVKQNYS